MEKELITDRENRLQETKQILLDSIKKKIEDNTEDKEEVKVADSLKNTKSTLAHIIG